MSEDWTKDIYIKLLGDLLGKELTNTKIYEPILHKENSMKVSGEESIDEQLVKSCDALKDILKASEMRVGVHQGYIEPCPISYTGAVITGKDKFRTAFIGLNPHLEPAKEFPEGTTLVDLANLHHPDDLIYNREDYRRNNDNDKKRIFINNYWRVFGHIEGKSAGAAWSRYYQTVIRVHLAFISEFENVKLNTWSEFKNDNEFQLTTEKILKLLKKYPMVNAELIPYKSVNYNMINFTEIFKSPNQFAENYISYYRDVWRFIDKYSEDDAYVFIPSSYSAKEETLTKVYKNIRKEIKEIRGEIYGEKYYFIKEIDKFKQEKNKEDKGKGKLILSETFENEYDKNNYKISPMYLCKWFDNKGLSRKVIITASLSGRGIYNWIYSDFGHGWIDALKEHYNQP